MPDAFAESAEAGPAAPAGTDACSGFSGFAHFAGPVAPASAHRARITAAYRAPEPQCVAALLDAARLPPGQAAATQRLAIELATALRQRKSSVGREGLVQGLIQEFSLSSQEGVALMCLAEALLRIPDKATRDALIRDKIGDADWGAHLGQSGSLFVNAATWGLVVTGKIVATHRQSGLGHALTRAIGTSWRTADPQGRGHGDAPDGRPVRHRRDASPRRCATRAQREREGFRYSYDMLGEAAITDADALRYLAAYEQAIDAIGVAAAGKRHLRRPGHLDQAVGAAPALQPRATGARAGRAVPAAAQAGADGARPRHRPEHRCRRGGPAGDLARPAGAAVRRARACRAGTASASWCRPTRSAAPSCSTT